MDATTQRREYRKLTTWIPVVGRWEFTDNLATYVGPQGDGEPYGICISDSRLTEGYIQAGITLKRVSDQNCGRLLIGYRSPSEWYVTAGLSGYGYAYVLADFVREYGWRALLGVGVGSNLRADTQYEVSVTTTGQRLTLSVADVRVFERVLEAPIPDGQVGLFAWGKERVEFSNVVVREVPGRVFVVMQFSKPYEQLYVDVIQPVAESFGLKAYHVADVYGPGVILQDIAEGLIDAKVVIAEITPVNANVFYELGFAHALGKPTILLAERGLDLPFDVRPYRCLFYDNTIGGKKAVEDGLRKYLGAILRDHPRRNGNGSVHGD